MSGSIIEICSSGPVIPVIEIDDAGLAPDLAKALMAGGVYSIEITLRTPQALDAINAVSAMDGLHVGAGTLLSMQDVKDAKAAGASFGVSPGSTSALVDACEGEQLSLLPGAATPSEVATLLEKGFAVQKFFPAEAAGGIAMLKAMGGPLQNVSFCPTGGVSPDNTAEYLALKNVICVGGSWIAPRKLIAEKNWSQIESNAKLASKFAS